MTWWESFKHKHSNLPNGLSLLRAVIGTILPLFLLSSNRLVHVAAGLLFTFAAITDYWDGWIARRQGLESNFGKILDPTSDKFLILCPLAMFAHLDYFSKWWLVPIFVREIIITFCRIGWLLEGKAAGAEKLGKIKLVMQVVMIAAPFLVLMSRDFAILGRFEGFFDQLTLLLLAVTNGLTILSGITFISSNRHLFHSPAFAKYVSACGVGLLPGTTGTWGSLLALIFIPLLAWNAWLYWGVFLFLFWAGYWSVGRLDLSKVKDPHFVVIDEVLGIFVTFAFVPLHLSNLLAGFVLFRLFDIFKPFPCRQLEKLPGFWGITLDDLGAGAYACLILRFLKI